MSLELQYISLIVALFIVPKFLQRYRIPGAITCIVLGMYFGMGLNLFKDDNTVRLLSMLGIGTLFLFAGLDINFNELRRGWKVLLQHLAMYSLLLAIVTYIINAATGFELRASALVALALLTPSTGFILDHLPSFGLNEKERFWTKSMAIATELLALVALFFILQSTDVLQFTISITAIIGMILMLPLIFKIFAKYVVPYAPKSEFVFVIIMAIICASITKRLGVYYLVGAFIVGVAAQRFRALLPVLASDKMLHAVEAFATFFIPFYFFKAGLQLVKDDFDIGAVFMGAFFLLIVLPIRILLLAAHLKAALKEHFKSALRVGASVTPTLVFTLVIAQILKERFQIPNYLFGGLIIYTIVNTFMAGFISKLPLPEYDTPEIIMDRPESAPQLGGTFENLPD